MSQRHKFGAVRAERDGHKFDSKAEAARFDELVLLRKDGRVVFFLRQPKFHLPGGGTFSADFQVFWRDGTVTFEDVKGMITSEFKRIRRIVEATYPVRIDIYPESKECRREAE